ncbi:hypothetical protein AALA54_07450, partial [Oscillospiraceae bacterium 44-34]
EIKLFKNLGSVNGNTFLNRDAVAQVTLNALKADVVTTVKNGGDITIGDATINLGNIEYKKVETGEAGYTGDADTNSNDYKYQQLCEKLYEDKLTFGADKDGSENDALGRPAKTWVYDNKNIITVTDDAKYSIVVNKSGENTNYWANEAKKNLTTDGDVISVNGDAADSNTDIDDLEIGDVVEFYDVTDNKAATVVVTRYSVGKITEVRACDADVKSEKEAMEDDGAAYVVEIAMNITGSKTEFFDTDITGFTGGDYVEDAYIAYVEGDDDNLIASYIPETIDGKVTATGSDFIRVDGEKYTVNDNVTASLDSEYTFVLDSNNYIIGAEETKGADVALDEVYYVVGEPYTTTDTKYGKDTVTMNIQVVAMDGTTKDFPLYSWVDATGGTDGEYDQATEEDSLKGVIPASDFFTNNHFIVLEENADDDGYYDAKATLGEINSDYTANNTALTVADDTEIKADGTRLGDTRVNASTKYVIAEGEGADLKVHQATGGVNYKKVSGDNVYAITEMVKGTKVALYVVMAVSSYDSSIDSDDVVYVDADADVEQVKVGGKTRYQFEIYDNSGKTMTVISSVDISNDSNSGKTGFVTYSIKDEDGTDVYDFKAIANVNLSDKYDKQKGDKAGNFASYYEDELTLDVEHFADIKAGDAVIIDLHDKDIYGKNIRSLEDMFTAKDNGYTVALNVYLDDGAKMIVVTGVTKTPTPKTKVSTVTFGSSFNAPAKDQALATAALDSSGNEHVEIVTQEWFAGSDTTPSTGNAAASTIYKLVVTLKIKDADASSYEFADSVTGATLASKNGTWDASAKTLTFTFEETAS